MTELELESGKKIQHFVPGKGKIPASYKHRPGLNISGFFFFWAYRRVEWQKKQPPYQVAKACISKLEQEEASSFIQTEWQTESSPTAVLATNLGDSESPSQKWVHRKRALQIKCKPPQEGSTAYDIGSSQEQISHLRQKVQMAKN